MVVVVPVHGERAAPPLYGVLHGDDGVPIATLCITKYDLWSLRATHVESVASTQHERLVGASFTSLAAAAQRVHEVIRRKQTDYLRSVKLYLRPASHGGILPSIIAAAPISCRILAHEPLAHAHIAARMQSHPVDVGGGSWLEVGKARPFIPHDLSKEAALNPRIWTSFTPPQERASDANKRAR